MPIGAYYGGPGLSMKNRIKRRKICPIQDYQHSQVVEVHPDA
ncbi:hypothetical protein LCGC14_2671610, partial [marine sediment metagenome]